jgi:hypothetical protein
MKTIGQLFIRLQATAYVIQSQRQLCVFKGVGKVYKPDDQEPLRMTISKMGKRICFCALHQQAPSDAQVKLSSAGTLQFMATEQ